MSIFFDYPRQAAFGRVLPKNKVYERGRPSTKVKELFVHQVEKIIWKYKLAPETINIRATNSVPEIQIFNIILKNGELKDDVLRCIDKAIPFPIFFEIYHNGKCRTVAAYKRPNEADNSKWLVSSYFETRWMAEDKPRKPLPITLNLGKLYEELLSPLIPIKARGKENLKKRVERAELICTQQQELSKTEARLRKEKQFNYKIAINAEIRTIRQQLKALK